MFLLSTPYGKRGFFYEAWNRPEVWDRFQVQPAYELDHTIQGVFVVDATETEEHFRERLLREGIEGYYSPQHSKEWLAEELMELSEWGWKQEYGLEFLDTLDQVFDTDMVLNMFRELDPFVRRGPDAPAGDAEPFRRAG